MSTIGQKQVVAVTGLGLSLFVLMHMLGNVLIFVGPRAYNLYSHQLVSNPLIIPIEMALLAMFLIHLGLALRLSFKNAAARPSPYAGVPLSSVITSSDKGTSLVACTLWHQGVVLLVFVVYHLITFKFGPHYEVIYEGLVVRDLHRLVLEVFQSPLYVIGYVVALAVLAFHLSHGVASALQSLGLYWARAKCAAQVYALIVGLGFALPPLYVFFT